MPLFRSTLALIGVVGILAAASNVWSYQNRIRSQRAEQQELKEVTYPVIDLTCNVINLDDFDIVECWRRLPECAPWFAAINDVPSSPNTLKMDQFLIRLITTTIEPASWAQVGGTGSLEFLPDGHKLVVKQSESNQEKVKELIAALRRVLDVEVAVETRLVSLSPRMAKMFTSAADLQPAGEEQTFLNDRQVKALMEFFQEDRSSSIMQAPKLTIFNGQRANICIGDELVIPRVQIADERSFTVNERVKMGFFFEVTPVVSIDRKMVQVKLDLCLQNLVGSEFFPGFEQKNSSQGIVTPAKDVHYKLQDGVETIKVSRDQLIPGSRTMVVALCNKLIESRSSNVGPPVLSSIPYINRLFTNVGYGREEQEVFLFVTPRVILNTSSASQPN